VRKLPKWAQEYIEDLKRDLERTQDQVTLVSAQHPGSNLMLDGKRGYPAVSLPDSATVQFYLGKEREDFNNLIEVHHNRNTASGRERTSLEVTAYGGQLLVMPRVSNGIALMLSGKDRF
jgi:hypothetical protein